jgi:Rps23 Pro-64 3,4-dihydroxylase Tpa1-like proline 4-hydroxylase
LINSDDLKRINQDFPEIPGPANYDPDKLNFGPAFQQLLDTLNKPAFSNILGDKFGVQLTGYPSTITVRGFCELSDGDIHADHWTKIVTVLIYFNPEWPHQDGRLRLLNSADDIEDYAVEVTPENGAMLAFLRSDHSYHGHTRFVGERRILQMNWVKPSKFAQFAQKADRFLTHTIKRIARATGST